MKTLDLEYRYRMTLGGGVVMLPFSEAVKATEYPALCIFHPEDPMPAEKRSHLCQPCREGLQKALADIAEKWPDLEDGLAPAGRAASSERVSGTGDLHPPLPINPNVSDVMRVARAAVWSTVGQLVQDKPDARMPADHGTGVLAGWLAKWHVGYLASHPSVGHLTAVCRDLVWAADGVREQAYQCRPVEVEMRHSHCHQFTEDATGARVPCPGQLTGVLLPDGRKVVQCSADPRHLVPADAWFQIHSRRAARPARAMNTLKKKYLAGRTR